jgi:hypothetical protein
MSTKPAGLCIFGAAIMAAGLAGCAGSPASDDTAPHSFSELRIGRPRQAAETPPPVPMPAAPVRQAAAPAHSPHSSAVARVSVPPASHASAPLASLPPAEEAVGSLDPALAARRVNAYLAAQGFSAEDSDQGGVRIVTATRMAEPRKLVGEAACSLEAMRRPDFSAANLTVRLTPGAGGLEVGVKSSFVEVNTNLISGSLVRETCRSRGVIEAGVRQAAQGG